MAKFLYVYHGGSMPETPAENEAVMKAWETWLGSLGAAVVDAGNPTSQIRTVAANGSVSDGGTNPSSGYSIVSANTIDEAVRWAKECPVLAGGASVEVAEILEIM